MTGQQYIDLAMQHIDINDEATIRCAVSRYYYGLLHKTIDKLIEIDSNEHSVLKDNLVNKPVENYSIHGSVIREVKKMSNDAFTKIDISRKLRVIADYFLTEEFKDKIVEVKDYDDKPIKTFNNTKEIKEFLEETSKTIDSLKKRKKQTVQHGLGNNIDIQGLLSSSKKRT